MSNLSIETVKAASLLGHDRSKIVEIENECEVIISTEPGQGGHTIFTSKGNKTSNATRLLRIATQGKSTKDGTGAQQPKKNATKRATPENEEAKICTHYLNNKCRFGDKCRNTHVNKKRDDRLPLLPDGQLQKRKCVPVQA